MAHGNPAAPAGSHRMRYVTRDHPLSLEQTWELAGRALCVGDGCGLPLAVPLGEIAAVRLEYAPTRAEPNRYRCTLTRRDGGELAFFNRTVRGGAEFEDRSAAFNDFVRTLHAVLAREAPGCRFRGGVPAGTYALNVLAVAFTGAVLLVAAVFVVSNGLGWLILLKVAVLAVFAPTLFRWLARNRPVRYAAGAIPARVLPPAGRSPGR